MEPESSLALSQQPALSTYSVEIIHTPCFNQVLLSQEALH
jgi:hypothetical protein